MSPVLSIIVPIYKVESYLNACVDSILSQPFKDFELILVDDGSPDHCGTMCDEYAEKDQRIKVIHQSNGGLSSARNAGIDIATGDYITFVDSDDTIAQDTYARNMEILLADHSIDLLEYPVYVHYKSPAQHIWKQTNTHVYGSDNLFVYWIDNHYYRHSYAWNKIYKTGLFKDIRFPVGKTFEDIQTLPLILKKVEHFFISEYGLYYYYLRSSSITTSTSYNNLRNLLDGNITVWKELKQHQVQQQSMLIYYLYIVNILIDVLNFSGEDKSYYKQMLSIFKPVHVSLADLMRLDIPKRTKYKNLSLVVMSLNAHCHLYHLLYKLQKKK